MLMSEERATYDLSPLGQAAVDYARRGYWVFPCEPRGKKPLGRLVPHGLNQASNDPAVIADWWTKQPNANIGISCGPSKLVVVDVDPRHGGDESIRDLMAKYPEMDDTLTGETGGGGWHLCFLAPAVPISNSTGSLAPGLDVRGVGGYIVAPPSIHPDGKAYEWMAGYGIEEKLPAKLPLPLIEALTTSPDGADAPVDVAAVLGGVGEGERDWQLFRLAAKLRYADLPIDWAYRLVGEAAAACVPAFPADEARKKVESAYRYPAGKVAVVAEPVVDPETGAEVVGLGTPDDLWAIIRDGVPEPSWLVQDILVPGGIHMLHGEPEHGKTWIALWAVRELARSGRRILVIDEETGKNRMAEKLQTMGFTEGEVNMIRYFGFRMADFHNFDDLAQRIAHEVDDYEPALVVFDSLADALMSAGMDENDAIDVTRWITTVCTYTSQRTGAAFLLIDHITKAADNTRYSRGSGAKLAEMDVAWLCKQVFEFDRTRVGIVDLIRKKNRPGTLKEAVRFSIGGYNGEFVCEPFNVNRPWVTINEVPDAERKIIALLITKGDEGAQKAELLEVAGVGKTKGGDHIANLLKEGRIRAEGATKDRRFYSTAVESQSIAVESNDSTTRPHSPFRGVRAVESKTSGENDDGQFEPPPPYILDEED